MLALIALARVWNLILFGADGAPVIAANLSRALWTGVRFVVATVAVPPLTLAERFTAMDVDTATHSWREVNIFRHLRKLRSQNSW